MSGAARITAIILVCAGWLVALPGCAAVKVINADGSEDISIRPLTTGYVGRTDGPQLIRVTALGVSSNQQGFDVGLRTEDIVVAPPKCHAIMVVRSEAEAETAGKLAKLVDRSCIVQR